MPYFTTICVKLHPSFPNVSCFSALRKMKNLIKQQTGSAYILLSYGISTLDAEHMHRIFAFASIDSTPTYLGLNVHCLLYMPYRCELEQLADVVYRMGLGTSNTRNRSLRPATKAQSRRANAS